VSAVRIVVSVWGSAVDGTIAGSGRRLAYGSLSWLYGPFSCCVLDGCGKPFGPVSSTLYFFLLWGTGYVSDTTGVLVAGKEMEELNIMRFLQTWECGLEFNSSTFGSSTTLLSDPRIKKPIIFTPGRQQAE